jgi:hypothetical protein
MGLPMTAILRLVWSSGWDCWTKEVNRREEARRNGSGHGPAANIPTKKIKLEGKYMANACSAKNNGGWTVEGLRCYTAIFQEVRNDRERDLSEAALDGRKAFGACFLACKKNAAGLNQGKQKGARVAELESIYIVACFSSDSESSKDEDG